MMKKLWISAACGALALSACSQPNDSDNVTHQEDVGAADAIAPATSDAAATSRASTEATASAKASAVTSAKTQSGIDAARSEMVSPSAPRTTESEAPPAVPTSSSPRVAFAHDYAFELPSKRISAVQEKHGRLCQELGTAQCEVTDMDYRLDPDGKVGASTSFLLAPQVANLFGASAIAAVDQANGKLIEGGMRGEDAGGLIEQFKADNAERSRTIAILEQQAKSLRPGSPEQVSVQNDIANLRYENEQGAQGQARARASLARTPITFTYESGSGWFSSGDSLIAGGSDNAALSSLNAMLSLIGIVAPWLLLIGAVVWAWRRFGSKSRHAAATHGVPDSTE